ncbi:hypothetical protein SAMN05660485_03101 [Blastococcus fimeti]|nr:hypothetical protein SAMN05660485_03101 [Blastococcus fimeti]
MLLLAGCGAGAQPDAPARDKAATEKPAAAPVADSGSRVDWKAAAYAALDCTPRAEWLADDLPAAGWDDETVRTTAADVTGDGAEEILVQATCPAAASTLADHVVVFALAGATPELLGVLGEELFLPEATVSLDGTTVTLSGPTVAGEDPYCCPGHRGTVTYAWDGVRFVVATRSEVPGSSPAATALPDGEHVGLLLSVGPDEVVVDVVEWFEGDAARAACRADGVPIDESAWCTQYYVRGAGDGGVPVPVSADAPLRYLELETMETVALGDVTELAGTPWVSENPDAGGYTRFRTRDGVITAMESIYTP